VLVNCCVLTDCKTKEGVYQFRNIATEVAHLVKYRGSLSGEHGDGIVTWRIRFYDWRKTTLLNVLNCISTEFSFEYGEKLSMRKMDENLRFETGRENPISKPFKIFR
jgi:hypothetical protein